MGTEHKFNLRISLQFFNWISLQAFSIATSFIQIDVSILTQSSLSSITTQRSDYDEAQK